MTLGQLGKCCSEHGGLLAGLVIGLAVVGWGAINCIAGLAPPERQTISVAELEAGKPLPGKWLEITGQLAPDDRIIWRGPETRETYVPLVSRSWQPLQPVAVYVRAREDHWQQPGRLLHHEEPSVAGMVDRSGLDEDLAKYFVEFGYPPRLDAIILDFEREPGTQTLWLGYIGLGIGGTILFITGLVWLIQRFRTAPVTAAEAPHE
jgi:hypothetical protein